MKNFRTLILFLLTGSRRNLISHSHGKICISCQGKSLQFLQVSVMQNIFQNYQYNMDSIILNHVLNLCLFRHILHVLRLEALKNNMYERERVVCSISSHCPL